MKTIRTCDLYYGAYLLSRGNKLEGTDVLSTGKRKVFFIFTGAQLEEDASVYASGHATVNLNSFKSSIKHLKDIIYEDVVQPTYS